MGHTRLAETEMGTTRSILWSTLVHQTPPKSWQMHRHCIQHRGKWIKRYRTSNYMWNWSKNGCIYSEIGDLSFVKILVKHAAISNYILVILNPCMYPWLWLVTFVFPLDGDRQFCLCTRGPGPIWTPPADLSVIDKNNSFNFIITTRLLRLAMGRDVTDIFMNRFCFILAS